MNLLYNNIMVFIKNPVWRKDINLFSIQKFKKILYALLLYILYSIAIAIFLVALNSLLKLWFNIDLLELHKHNFDNVFKRLGNKFALCTIVIIAPILEEIMFRLWFGLNKYMVSVSLALITLKIVASFNHHNLLSLNLSIYEILISIIVGVLFLFFVSDKKLTIIRDRYFKVFYYFSAISFGIAHISNFSPIHYLVFWAYPFFVLPQLGLGFILGFVRTKYGFIWCVLLHVLVNFSSSITDIVKLFYHF